MATVDIVIPTRSGVHPEASPNLSAMIRETHCFCGTHPPWKCNKGKHSVRFLPHTRGSSVVHWARNQILAMALYGQEPSPDGRPDAEYLFLMDDDMLCQPGYLNRMLSYKLDFVTGVATIRRDPPRPNIRYWDEKEGWYTGFTEWDWESNKLLEIDAVGAAFMLIRRKVFEKVGESWLACQFERERDKRRFPTATDIDAYWDKQGAARRARFAKAITPDGDWKEADCWWFQFIEGINDQHVGELGEDIGFCWKAKKKLGFEIFADPQIKPGHIGYYGYTVDDWRDHWEAEKQFGRIAPGVQVNAAGGA